MASDRPPIVVVVPAMVLGCVVTAAWWSWQRWQSLVDNVLTERPNPIRFDRDPVRARRRRRNGEALSTRRHEFR